MTGDIEMLPGLEEFARHVDRPGAEDLSDGKRYTAMTLLRDYPDVYRQAARALFFYRLPVRTVKDLFRLSSETVAAIRDQVLASQSGAASFFSKLRTTSQRDIVQARLLDAIEERLADPATLAEMDTDKLVGMLATLDRARPASNGVDAPAGRSDVTIVSSDDFDAAVGEIGNGLSGDKKTAAIGCGDDGATGSSASGPASAPGVVACVLACVLVCSTWYTFGGRGSLQLSNNTQCLRGNFNSWCNLSCNRWVQPESVGPAWVLGRSVAGSVASPAPVARVCVRAPGGAGAPGGARRGGSPTNVFAESQSVSFNQTGVHHA